MNEISFNKSVLVFLGSDIQPDGLLNYFLNKIAGPDAIIVGGKQQFFLLDEELRSYFFLLEDHLLTEINFKILSLIFISKQSGRFSLFMETIPSNITRGYLEYF